MQLVVVPKDAGTVDQRLLGAMPRIACEVLGKNLMPIDLLDLLRGETSRHWIVSTSLLICNANVTMKANPFFNPRGTKVRSLESTSRLPIKKSKFISGRTRKWQESGNIIEWQRSLTAVGDFRHSTTNHYMFATQIETFPDAEC